MYYMHACMQDHQDHLDWCALSSWLIIDLEDKAPWSLIIIDKTLAKAEVKLNETPHHSGLLCHDQTFPDRAPCQNHDHVISYQPATCAQQPGEGSNARYIHTFLGPWEIWTKFYISNFQANSVAEVSLVKLHSDECDGTLLISQHWFR